MESILFAMAPLCSTQPEQCKQQLSIRGNVEILPSSAYPRSSLTRIVK